MAILHPQNLIFATVTILAKAITPSRTGPPRFLVTILRPQNTIITTAFRHPAGLILFVMLSPYI